MIRFSSLVTFTVRSFPSHSATTVPQLIEQTAENMIEDNHIIITNDIQICDLIKLCEYMPSQQVQGKSRAV